MRVNKASDIKTRFSQYAHVLFKILACGVFYFATACQGDSSASAQESNTSSPQALAKKILGHELKAPEKDINVVSVENMTWGDSSLGCPEPGKFYAQMLVDGHLVVATYNKQNYNVHMGNGGGRVCYLPEGILPTPEKY